ncbi:uncharacterized protein [Triticum aestivum]|uniref:uncharacterized protein n=1 Tax=Triticum aestivum TaxID=4565 RepID=UPI001D00781B|nr:uncharacterized protein LOC123056977 [Triticum aestivum]
MTSFLYDANLLQLYAKRLLGDRSRDRFRPRVAHLLFPFPFYLVSFFGKAHACAACYSSFPFRLPPRARWSPSPTDPLIGSYSSAAAALLLPSPLLAGGSSSTAAALPLPSPLLAGCSSLAAAANTARLHGGTGDARARGGSGQYGEAPRPHERHKVQGRQRSRRRGGGSPASVRPPALARPSSCVSCQQASNGARVTSKDVPEEKFIIRSQEPQNSKGDIQIERILKIPVHSFLLSKLKKESARQHPVFIFFLIFFHENHGSVNTAAVSKWLKKYNAFFVM